MENRLENNRNIVGFDYFKVFFCLSVVAWHIKILGGSDMFHPETINTDRVTFT